MKSKKTQEKEYNGSDIEYEQEEEKKFTIKKEQNILRFAHCNSFQHADHTEEN